MLYHHHQVASHWSPSKGLAGVGLGRGRALLANQIGLGIQISSELKKASILPSYKPESRVSMRLCVQSICAMTFLLREASSLACSGIDVKALKEGKDSQLLTCTAGDPHHDLMAVASKIVEADSDKAYSIFTLLLSNVGCPVKLADLVESLPKEKPELHLAVLGECYDLKNGALFKSIPPGTFLHEFIQEIDGAMGEDDVLDLQAKQSSLLPILPNVLLRQVGRGKTSPKWSPTTLDMMINNPLANGRLKRAVRAIAQNGPSQLATLNQIAGHLMYHEDYLLTILEAVVLAHQFPTTLAYALETIGVDRIRGILDLFKDVNNVELHTFNLVAGLVNPPKALTPVVVEGVPTAEAPNPLVPADSAPSETTLVIPGPPPPPPPPPPLLTSYSAKKKEESAKGAFTPKPEEFVDKMSKLRAIQGNIGSAFRKGEVQPTAGGARFNQKMVNTVVQMQEPEAENEEFKASDWSD